MRYSYAIGGEKEENIARARAEDINASYKDLTQVCNAIRNKNAAWAVGFLEDVAEGTQAVLYKRYNKKIGHRRELGGKKGRFPRKAASFVLKLLKSAIANAKGKSLFEPYIIVHAAANKKHVYPRLASKGRRMRAYYETARVELVLKETEEKKKERQQKAVVKPQEIKQSEEKSVEKAAAKPTEAKEEKKLPKHENAEELKAERLKEHKTEKAAATHKPALKKERGK